MPVVATRAAAAYRFTWMRSFDPAISVRIEHHTDTNAYRLGLTFLALTGLDLEPIY
ncbi:MAG: hypothetical protein NXI31_13020 [bacterium]|nr:hypothetical protein [bacterium]